MNATAHQYLRTVLASLSPCVLILCALMLSAPVQAATTAALEDPERLRQLAEDHVMAQSRGGELKIQVHMPDTRLSLPRCAQTPQASGQRHGLRMQLKMSCPGRWQIYLPVTLEQHREVLVTRRSLSPGEIISEADLKHERVKLRGADYGHFSSAEAVLGRRVAQPIMAGQILRPAQLRQAWAVHKGDHVTLLSRYAGIEIRSRGEAQHNALENAPVSVRNLSSGKIVRGTCRGQGLVEIQG